MKTLIEHTHANHERNKFHKKYKAFCKGVCGDNHQELPRHANYVPNKSFKVNVTPQNYSGDTGFKLVRRPKCPFHGVYTVEGKCKLC